MGRRSGTMLAISLHATNDALRDELVPINRKYPIAALLEACRNYPGLSNARRITFEYVMLKGVNDSLPEARALVRLLAGIPSKINLIPFNPWPGAPYECSDWEQIERFAEVVNKAGYASPVRTPRGRDIQAACGQLRSASSKLRASERVPAAAHSGSRAKWRLRLTVWRTLGRMLLVPLGVCAAAAASSFVLVTLGLERVTGMLHRSGGDVFESMFNLMNQGLVLTTGLTIIPGLLVILIGEVASIRSSVYYIVGGGIALVAIPLLSQFGESGNFAVPDQGVWQVFGTAGFAGGFVYWLIAGRNA